MRLRTRVAPFSSLLILLSLSACGERTAPISVSASTPSRASPPVVEAVRTATTRAPGRTERVAVPGGGQLDHVVLGDGYQHVVVGRLEPDGTVSTSCVDSAPQAEAFLSGRRQADVQ